MRKLGFSIISFIKDTLTFSPPLRFSIFLEVSSPVNKKPPAMFLRYSSVRSSLVLSSVIISFL